MLLPSRFFCRATGDDMISFLIFSMFVKLGKEYEINLR